MPSAKDLETEMRRIMSTATTGGVSSDADCSVVAYAGPPLDEAYRPWSQLGPVSHDEQYIALLKLIVRLEAQLAEVRNQVAELKLAFENRDVIEGWSLSREQFIQLAEAAHKIISGVAKPKRVRKPKSTGR